MNMDGSSSVGSYVVTGLAIVGIALAGSALYVGLNGRAANAQRDDRISELEQKIEHLRGADEELQGQIRGLYNQTSTAIDNLATQLNDLKPKVAQPVPPPVPTTSVATETSAKTQPSAPSGKTYTVRAGDYPAKIAKANNITVNALMKANPGLNPSKLKPGQVLQLP